VFSGGINQTWLPPPYISRVTFTPAAVQSQSYPEGRDRSNLHLPTTSPPREGEGGDTSAATPPLKEAV